MLTEDIRAAGDSAVNSVVNSTMNCSEAGDSAVNSAVNSAVYSTVNCSEAGYSAVNSAVNSAVSHKSQGSSASIELTVNQRRREGEREGQQGVSLLGKQTTALYSAQQSLMARAQCTGVGRRGSSQGSLLL